MATDQDRGPSRRPLIFLAVPAGIAIWSGWVGLGGMTGFGKIDLFPGLPFGLDHFAINTAITLPFSAELYGAYAFHVWTRATDPRVRRMAKWSCLGAFVLGFLAQVSFHLLNSHHVIVAPWIVTVLVSAVPVAAFMCGTGLWSLMRDSQAQPVADDVADLAEEEADEQPDQTIHLVPPPPDQDEDVADSKPVEQMTVAEIRAAIARWPSERKLATGLGVTRHRATQLIKEHAQTA